MITNSNQRGDVAKTTVAPKGKTFIIGLTFILVKVLLVINGRSEQSAVWIALFPLINGTLQSKTQNFKTWAQKWKDYISSLRIHYFTW